MPTSDMRGIGVAVLGMPKIAAMWMTVRRRMPNKVLAAALLSIVLGTSALVGAPTAGAAPVAPAQNQCGNVNANPTISSSRNNIGVSETAVVTVTGSNYLLPPHVCGTDVFGGIYVFFGWVQPGGQWGPSFRSSTSPQGLFGVTYSYPGEGGGAETRDDGTGVVRLVSFTAGGESGDSTDFHMDAKGNWKTTLTVRGATYSYVDVRTGTQHSVDCRVVQCGVFSIGAHAKASRTNERFTPINFSDPSGAVIVPSNPDAGGAGGSTGTVPSSGGSVAANSSGGQPASPTGGDTASPEGSGQTTSAAGGATNGDQVGSIGEAPTDDGTGAPEGSKDSEGTSDTLPDQETAAAVQNFDDSSSGGTSPALLGGLLALLVVVGGGGTWFALRRRGATAAGDASTSGGEQP